MGVILDSCVWVALAGGQLSPEAVLRATAAKVGAGAALDHRLGLEIEVIL